MNGRNGVANVLEKDTGCQIFVPGIFHIEDQVVALIITQCEPSLINPQSCEISTFIDSRVGVSH